MTPNDRKYSTTHEWVKVDGELAVVGISDHAQEALGDITFLELPKAGTSVEKGTECGVIESVKAASDIYSPIGGEIAEANDALENAPEQVNQSPYDTGWLFKVKGIDHAEIDALMSADDYETFLKEQE
ncbi:MAG: glycine cleavage system protein GcvH [Chitinivibrionales bacterium]|nr:glycine cleavage system protein GcvH [Chitinivibrionales bacterium]MBD3394570.1 glycine cleavage system protein GcvH [Chitinivibrionales bacterium]